MTKVISSTAEFLNALKPGDSFWHVKSVWGMPVEIEGPFIIYRFDTRYILCEELSPKVFPSAKSPIFRRRGTYYAKYPHMAQRLMEDGFFVNDLTQPDHGVLLAESEEEALAYLEERKLAFQNDPAAITRSEEWREISRIEDEEDLFRRDDF